MALRRIGPGFNFDQNMVRFQQFKVNAPRVIAEQSKNHFMEGFQNNGGKTNDSKSGWLPRDPKAPRNDRRNILVDTGALRRSLTVIKQTWDSIIIGTRRVDYADRHNEGITDSRGRAMPKREFIGDSDELNEKNKKTLATMIARIFR